MIVIPNKEFTSDITLYSILVSMKKDKILDISKKLDIWVSPNVSKDKTASRVAADMLESPEYIYSKISKTELP